MSLFGLDLKSILVLLAFVYVIYGGALLVKSIRPRFDKDVLYGLVAEKNLLDVHGHSIVLIRDRFNEAPNRFLVYDDPRWGCRLFVNCKTAPADEDNIANIVKRMHAELKVPIERMECFFVDERVHSKYSVSHNEERWYDHKFYELCIDGFTDEMERDDFTIDGQHYHWMSIAQMEDDNAIMRFNPDIVGMVKSMSL